MKNSKVLFGTAVLLLAGAAVFATKNNKRVGAFYLDSTSICQPTVQTLCSSTPGLGCIKTVPEDGGALHQLYTDASCLHPVKAS